MLCYPFLTYNVFTADKLRHAVSLTFDPSTMNVCNVSAVTLSKHTSEFEQKAQKTNAKNN